MSGIASRGWCPAGTGATEIVAMDNRFLPQPCRVDGASLARTGGRICSLPRAPVVRREGVVRVSDNAGVPQPGNRQTARYQCPDSHPLQRAGDAHGGYLSSLLLGKIQRRPLNEYLTPDRASAGSVF
jgi:hypothetical protein